MATTNDPRAGQRSPGDHLAGIAGRHGEGDQGEQRDRRDQQSLGEDVRDQSPAVAGLSPGQLAAGGDVEARVHDGDRDADQRQHGDVASGVGHSEVAQQKRCGRDPQGGAGEVCRQPRRAATDDLAAGLGRGQNVVVGVVHDPDCPRRSARRGRIGTLAQRRQRAGFDQFEGFAGFGGEDLDLQVRLVFEDDVDIVPFFSRQDLVASLHGQPHALAG